MTDTRRLLPFLWLHGEDEDTLRRGIRAIAESGCGSLCAESRTHPDFLGPTWWREIDVITDECRRLGLTYYLLDDTHFPSGFANGAAKDTPFARMMLTEKHMDVSGPRRGGYILARADGDKGFPVAVVAGRRVHRRGLIEGHVDMGGWAVDNLVDLTDNVAGGMLRWDVPEGDWRVFVMTADYVSERNPPQVFANPLLPEGGRLMIDTVYEAHYAHLQDEFGKTFRGFFSDEPALRAGRGCRAVLGEYPMLPVPWRLDMPEILTRQMGQNVRRLLPGLWYDVGEDTPRLRYALMDTVSRLYQENYSQPIGDWCRAHGVSYIGHVIEQNNAHSRLGQGAGHFFRAMGGQDMAGMDFVLHELKPEFRGTSHAWKSQDFEADDDFFRYMLPQMTVSCAHLDEKKQGRSLCEVFGAYGWQEDAEEMRYLANLLLSRGVNHFTPHAFTLKPFPDPDSPPHFGDFNPLMPALTRLHGHMARAGSLLDGGEMVARAGALYYAEAEWAEGKGCMKTQAIVRELSLRHVPCEIVPIDLLEPGRYDALYIPRGKMWPEKLFHRLRVLMDAGCRVVFVDALPEGLSEGQGDIHRLTEGMHVVSLSAVGEDATAHVTQPVRALTDSPDIYLYLYRRQEGLLAVLFNEDVRKPHAITLTAEAFAAPVLYDSEQEACFLLPPGDTCEITVEPGQLLMLGDRLPSWPEPQPLPRYTPAGEKWPTWRITFSDPALPPVTTDRPEAVNGLHPRFSGRVRYEAEVDLAEGRDALLLPEMTGTAEVWLDGERLGYRAAPPYRFDLPEGCHGPHTLRLETVVPLVQSHRDALSFFNYIKPAGLTGPVQWLHREVHHG